MKITINNNIGKYDIKEFTITKSENIEIEFDGLSSANAFYICQIRDSKLTKQIKNNVVTIEEKYIKAGILKSFIEIREDDVCIKKIKVDNLIISSIDNTYEIIPEIEELKNIIKSYSSKIDNLNSNIETLVKLVGISIDLDSKKVEELIKNIKGE